MELTGHHGLDAVDLAKSAPCPNECGRIVRRFSETAIAGTGLDTVKSGPWWCPECLHAKTVAALAAVGKVEDVEL